MPRRGSYTSPTCELAVLLLEEKGGEATEMKDPGSMN